MRRSCQEMRASPADLSTRLPDLRRSSSEVSPARLDLLRERLDLPAVRAELPPTRADLSAARSDLDRSSSDLDPSRSEVEGARCALSTRRTSDSWYRSRSSSIRSNQMERSASVRCRRPSTTCGAGRGTRPEDDCRRMGCGAEALLTLGGLDRYIGRGTREQRDRQSSSRAGQPPRRDSASRVSPGFDKSRHRPRIV